MHTGRETVPFDWNFDIRESDQYPRFQTFLWYILRYKVNLQKLGGLTNLANFRDFVRPCHSFSCCSQRYFVQILSCSVVKSVNWKLCMSWPNLYKVVIVGNFNEISSNLLAYFTVWRFFSRLFCKSWVAAAGCKRHFLKDGFFLKYTFLLRTHFVCRLLLSSFICYWPVGRSVLGETLPKVLRMAGSPRRPTAVLKTVEDTVFPKASK